MSHIWHFATIGGVKRVSLVSSGDLLHLKELDQKLWTALSCPVTDLEIDKKTLELVDADNDGHIHVPEVIAAVDWILPLMRNPDELLAPSPEMPLSAVNDSTPQGKALLKSARTILKSLGKEQSESIAPEDTADLHKIFANTQFNGDGIVSADSASAPEVAALIDEIMKCCGSVTDRGGKQGIDQDIANLFFSECEKFIAWHRKGDENSEAIFSLGADTATAYQKFMAVKVKIDDFFFRTRLAAFDKQSIEALNLQTERVKGITEKSLPGCADEIATYPLATVGTDKVLPLASGINPAWESAMADFLTHVVIPLLGQRGSLTEDEWKKLSARFAPYEQWIGAKEGGKVEAIGLERLQAIISGDTRSRIDSLIALDKVEEEDAANIILVDKLVRFYQNLALLLRNFVTFSDFYAPERKAIFQAGTLYIDQRSCDLCIKVQDMGRHALLAHYSGMFLIYCECTSKVREGKMTIVAALTNGDVDDLVVGRNAVFYDRDGVDWNATIIKITENPTSIRQAFFAPYRRVSRFVEDQINKAAAAADEKSNAKLAEGVSSVKDTPADDKAKKETKQAFDVAKFAGIFAAIGLALGAIGSTVTAIVSGFLKLPLVLMPFALMGTLLVISGPSMILAYLKLRKRNLSPILDANGWAINARLKVNIHFGRTLTHLASLPPNAKVNFNDPFAKKKNPWPLILLAVLLVCAAVFYLLWKGEFLHLNRW
ncbi:MAG: hypothetical protein KF744_10030 [Taibaiella sp.]|nr:hypothetical protein [Taibaiella sp.]